MSWTAKLKEKAQEHTLAGFFAVVLLLLGIIWAAIPSEVWGRISEKVPNRVLWATVGLLVMAVVLESAYVYTLRKEIRRLKGEGDAKPVFMFGANWDKNQNPLCPSCVKPLTLSTRKRAYVSGMTLTPDLQYSQCDKYFPLRDDSGNKITLAEAKKHLAERAT